MNSILVVCIVCTEPAGSIGSSNRQDAVSRVLWTHSVRPVQVSVVFGSLMNCDSVKNYVLNIATIEYGVEKLNKPLTLKNVIIELGTRDMAGECTQRNKFTRGRM